MWLLAWQPAVAQRRCDHHSVKQACDLGAPKRQRRSLPHGAGAAPVAAVGLLPLSAQKRRAASPSVSGRHSRSTGCKAVPGAREGGRSNSRACQGFSTMPAGRWVARIMHQVPGAGNAQKDARLWRPGPPPGASAAAAGQGRPAGFLLLKLWRLQLSPFCLLIRTTAAGSAAEPACTGCTAPSSLPPPAAAPPHVAGPGINYWVLSGLLIALVAVVAWGAYRLVRGRGWCGIAAGGDDNAAAGSGAAGGQGEWGRAEEQQLCGSCEV